MFQEAAEGFSDSDAHDKALTEFLMQDLARQEEKGKQLREKIEKAQQSIQQFMRSLPGAYIEEQGRKEEAVFA